jgi:septal ring factor EnvC (AmiA/AmiB activator)
VLLPPAYNHPARVAERVGALDLVSSGRVDFAAPFRSYGELLIVDCGGGYAFVLAGFSRLDVQVGQSIEAGEPVGVTPDWDPRNGASRPKLYMELRKDGLPVNPAPFLRAKG